MISSSDSSDLYTSTVQSGPLLLMLHSCPTLAFKPLIPLLPTLYLLLLLPNHCLLLLAVFQRLLLLLPPTPSGFFNGMLTISKPGALDCYTFFCPILLSLFVSRNPITTHLPLYGSIDSPLCDLIAPTSSLAFSLLMPPTLVAVLFSSDRIYPSLNFLLPLSSLGSTLIM